MEGKENQTIHVLIKGEQPKDTSDHLTQEQDEYIQEFARNSMFAILVPTLEFEYKNLDKLRESLTFGDGAKCGLILTSPRVVEAVYRSLVQSKSNLEDAFLSSLDHELVFPVGQKTARDWKQKTNMGYNLGAIESGHGKALAMYIKKFCEDGNQKPIRLIYPKSSLANDDIERDLSSVGKLNLQSLVVYETKMIENLCDMLVKRLENSIKTNPKSFKFINLIFFSPSGVRCLKPRFGKLEEYFRTNEMRLMFSSIGRTTGKALEESGFNVYCVADQPNASSLVEQTKLAHKRL